MAIKIKYVGPKDEKKFRGYFFERDMSDTGELAQEVPDAIANEALQNPDVFLPANRPVPARVKALREALPDAIEAEGKARVKSFAARQVLAEHMVTDDSPKKEKRRQVEIAGAQSEVEAGMALIRQANELRARNAGEAVAANVPGSAIFNVQTPKAANDQANDQLTLLLQGLTERMDAIAEQNTQLAAENAELRQAIAQQPKAEAPKADPKPAAKTTTKAKAAEAPKAAEPSKPAEPPAPPADEAKQGDTPPPPASGDGIPF